MSLRTAIALSIFLMLLTFAALALIGTGMPACMDAGHSHDVCFQTLNP